MTFIPIPALVLRIVDPPDGHAQRNPLDAFLAGGVVMWWITPSGGVISYMDREKRIRPHNANPAYAYQVNRYSGPR